MCHLQVTETGTPQSITLEFFFKQQLFVADKTFNYAACRSNNLKPSTKIIDMTFQKSIKWAKIYSGIYVKSDNDLRVQENGENTKLSLENSDNPKNSEWKGDIVKSNNYLHNVQKIVLMLLEFKTETGNAMKTRLLI